MTLSRRWQVLLLCLVAFAGAGALLSRDPEIPPRTSFREFPHRVQGYRSRDVPVDNLALAQLKLTDYLSRDYVQGDRSINLYIGFHGSQRRGDINHSPAHCLPANGWYIAKHERVPMPGTENGPLVNRMEIAYGEQRDIVYYWYQGRGRILAGEVTAAGLRAVDMALHNRGDEAIVRFITRDGAGAEGDLREFIEQINPLLDPYLPV